MGLAYNEPYLHEDSPMCTVCNSNALETEMHMLFHCPATETSRLAALRENPWLRMRSYETPDQHFIRVGKVRSYTKLAAYIRKMSDSKRDVLKRRYTAVRTII